MIGGMLVKFAFVACSLSIIGFFVHHLRGDARYLRYGRIFFHTTVISVIVTSAYFLYLILTHQFQYTYVWSYSSTDLSTPLLISTFYAGQEGSFMLWALFTSIIGVVLMNHSSKNGYEAQVMSVYGLIELTLLLMLLVKNPFLYVWESFPGELKAGFTPADGRGLNPLLQNYWMVIHPQVLFSGFASMSVPYAYAMAAMMKRDYSNWIRPATPWIVFSATVLGCGIMMGGFWAYETLGWGGYWAWDPVENSSLVPWLFAVATIHTTLSQRRSGAFVRTNIVLAMMCFISVLYSTFLTRSGVLGDTSVHSFVDPGMWVYILLVGIMVLFVGLGVFMLVRFWKHMPRVPAKHSYYSREFALFLGSATLVLSALFVTLGTSAPLITSILEGKASAVDISFYVKTILPLGIAIGVLAGIGQLLWWTRSNMKEVMGTLLWPAGSALLFTGVMAFFGGMEILVALFVFGAAFSLFANLQVGWRIVKGNPKYAGGAVAHIGIAIMFLGFVGSSKYDTKETLSLAEGKPVEALGYKLTYAGFSLADPKSEKYAFTVHVEKDGKKYTVAPIMYYSKFNEGLMRNPDIANLVTRDFYLAPLSLEQKENAANAEMERVTLKKGETRHVGEVQVKFIDFNFPADAREAMLEGKEAKIGASLQVTEYGKKAAMVTAYKLIKMGGEGKDLPAMLGDRLRFSLLTMHPDQDPEKSTAEIGVVDLKKAGQSGQAADGDVLVVEASVKPYINLVWSGVIIVLVGFIVTIFRRAQEARMKASVPA